VGPKALGNGNDAEYGPDTFRFLGTRNLSGTEFREFPWIKCASPRSMATPTLNSLCALAIAGPVSSQGW
jgi:hypothetical protein